MRINIKPEHLDEFNRKRFLAQSAESLLQTIINLGKTDHVGELAVKYYEYSAAFEDYKLFLEREYMLDIPNRVSWQLDPVVGVFDITCDESAV